MRNDFQRGGYRETGSSLRQSLGLVEYGAKFRRSALAAISLLLTALFIFSAQCKAQTNPTLKIEDEITRFAFSTNGRIAYATRHVFSSKKIDLQRDDIWICEPDGKEHRILEGQKFVRGSGPFSYTVHSIQWSPDNSKIAIELATSEMISNGGGTREGVSTLLLDDSGREITMGKDSVIPGASNCAWMADGTTGVCLFAVQPLAKPPAVPQRQEQQPKTEPLFTLARVTMAADPEVSIFPGRTFQAVTWNATKGEGVAIELAGIPAAGLASPALPINLVAVNPIRASSHDLGTLAGYAGGLSASPSGKKVAYWIDNGQLEVRDVDAPARVARLSVPVGTLAWSGDETRVMVKRGPENRSGGLIWLSIPPLVNVVPGAASVTVEVTPESVLHDLAFRLFEISPDGKSLAVVEPGRHNLLVYPIS
jgi:dipeptidyl aminopeptidase/acylaminoacyl peptidase